MPVISRFYGILIVMYFNDHNPPHFHAKHSGSEALFDFSGALIEGALPNRATRLVKEWLALHEEELSNNWQRARAGEPLLPIAPLDWITMLHVTKVKHVSKKTIWISFDNGTSGEVDLTDHLVGPIFEPLKDDIEFAKLRFDEELETVAWPNGADLAPEFLYGLLSKDSSKKRSA